MSAGALKFESSVKEKDHQTGSGVFARDAEFESSVKEKDHQTPEVRCCCQYRLRAV